METSDIICDDTLACARFCPIFRAGQVCPTLESAVSLAGGWSGLRPVALQQTS